ncbi:hypothetical protein AFK71_08240 [Virgibacillus pantothenticus]|uniref:Uncharacterized protein n=1 Tax=Virgibacillus pantothenticus TaxID=1473 RepID=A0A0L0QST8_VIRPA|nr:hypothetical protein AFK71_08240 [Virgibacillus pantothenticus]
MQLSHGFSALIHSFLTLMHDFPVAVDNFLTLVHNYMKKQQGAQTNFYLHLQLCHYFSKKLPQIK